MAAVEAATVPLSGPQLEAVAEMRRLFSGVDGEGLAMDDRTFERYLRARGFNVAKAQEMLAATVKWRKDFDIKSIHDGWQSVIEKENQTGKGYVRGFSSAGNVCLYLKPKHENTFHHDGNLKHLVYNMERACKVMEADGRGVEKLVLLIDYDGYSLLNAPPMKTSLETLSILQNHYPERLLRAYCIRPPWILNGFWTMISPFIDPVTYQKIIMLSGSTEDIGTRLSSDGIPRAALEESIGGTDRRPFLSRVYLGLGLGPGPAAQGGAAAADGSSGEAPVPPATVFASGPDATTTRASTSTSTSTSEQSQGGAQLPLPSAAEVFASDYTRLASEVAERLSAGSDEAKKGGWFW